MARVIGYSAVPILFALDSRPGDRWLPFPPCFLALALFLVNLPVGALAVVLAVLFLPKDDEELRPGRPRPRWADVAVAGASALSVRLGYHLGERLGPGSLLVSIVSFAAFCITATRRRETRP